MVEFAAAFYLTQFVFILLGMLVLVVLAMFGARHAVQLAVLYIAVMTGLTLLWPYLFGVVKAVIGIVVGGG